MVGISEELDVLINEFYFRQAIKKEHGQKREWDRSETKVFVTVPFFIVLVVSRFILVSCNFYFNINIVNNE